MPRRSSTPCVESCRAKAAVVAADEREGGVRALLNLGHTFAHGLEAACGYGDELLHGEAVAVGMVLAFDLSVRLGLCPAADADRVRAHLAAVGLPVTLGGIKAERFAVDTLLAAMGHDKKAQAGRPRFVLTRGIGRGVRRRRGRAGRARGAARGGRLIDTAATAESHGRFARYRVFPSR